MLTFIYHIRCKDTTITECYVGSTCNLKDRIRSHRSNCNNEKSKKHHYKVYKFIREHGGFDNWDFIIVKTFENITIHELKIEEQNEININGSLNIQRSFRTKEDWNNDKYENAKKHGLNNIYTCECGKVLQIRCKTRHLKTNKHQNYLKFQYC